MDLRLPAIESYVVELHGRPRALTPDEEDVLNKYGILILEYIVERWPVDTGTSADAWNVVSSVSPGEYGYLVENPMYYVQFVHRRGTAAEPPLWETLIPEAWGAYKADLQTELRQAIQATEARIAGQRATETPREATLNVYRAPLIERLLRVANFLRRFL